MPVLKMNLLKKLLLLHFVNIFGASTVDVTFKNVVFNAYEMFTPKFKAIILFGNSLKQFLPHHDFDNLEFLNQRIPILYANAIADLDELKELNMEFCDIKEIRPGAFRNLSHLDRLSLKINKLETIEKGVFTNLSIVTLDLSYNQISYIHPQALDNMPNMYHINLSHNLVLLWNPSWFKNSPRLSVLNFKNNLIEELPADSFKNFGTAKFLNLDIIFTLNKIYRLHPDAFAGLRKINVLSLSNNQLRSFDNSLLRHVTVNDLELNNNSIECFNGDLDEAFKASYTYIEYNPLECSCLKRIKRWCKKNNKDVGVGDAYCDEGVLPRIIEIEGVREVAKDTFAIQKITLILPDDS